MYKKHKVTFEVSLIATASHWLCIDIVRTTCEVIDFVSSMSRKHFEHTNKVGRFSDFVAVSVRLEEYFAAHLFHYFIRFDIHATKIKLFFLR